MIIYEREKVSIENRDKERETERKEVKKEQEIWKIAKSIENFNDGE